MNSFYVNVQNQWLVLLLGCW